MSDKKWVYRFSSELNEGNKEMKDLLGGKGANLAEMCSLGLPVPPGFTITTETCLDYEKNRKKINEEAKRQILSSILETEKLTGKRFGDSQNPLLFSVRSGARASMPGMMDTVLNLGLNDETVLGLAKLTRNPRFAWDSYRRFIQMYANVVLNFDISLLEAAMDSLKENKGVKEDTQLLASDLKKLTMTYKSIIKNKSGIEFPDKPMDQLWGAISAVFNSWNNHRAVKYREIYNIPHSWGTAVNVQSMVFGNMGTNCATGVCFTRDPSTGEKVFFGEYLINAQGEDVVAGIRTPQPINEFSKNESNKNAKTLEESMPAAFKELTNIYQKLETHYRDMQDIEFTIENKKLFILQTRNGKRTTAAAIKIAVDLVDEGILTKEEALMKLNPEDLNQMLHPRLDPNAKKRILTKGLPASPGAGVGKIVFTSETAQELAQAGAKVILVRQETSPEDIAGMVSSQGILTARGGMTSHAAVVARGMGKPCVAGCSDLLINLHNGTMEVGGKIFREGDFLTIDGTTGDVIEGVVPTIDAAITDDFAKFMSWADEQRVLKIRTNADTPVDCDVAVKFGAQGIGLCRTEHMFFEKSRILAVREMIFAENTQEREKALQKIIPYQREDFVGIFTAMNGHPVNIRLLDPPLHEFLPHTHEEKKELAESLGININAVEARGAQLHEFNPMLGHRGCRLGITFPEIYRAQVRAIIEAALICSNKGITVLPEIMMPLIATNMELSVLKEDAIKEINQVFKENNERIDYQIGTMIELPRAAIIAGKISPDVEYFSFGTNDLTQTTFGLSRDDSAKFLPDYVTKGLLTVDPFVSIDQEGVGFLVKFAINEGRAQNPSMHFGVCGEHGGDPASIEFFHKIGLDYVSCSPYRVPIARLAAAQAAIRSKKAFTNKRASINS